MWVGHNNGYTANQYNRIHYRHKRHCGPPSAKQPESHNTGVHRKHDEQYNAQYIHRYVSIGIKFSNTVGECQGSQYAKLKHS